MKLITFQQQGASRIGIWMDGEVVDLQAADSRLPADMLSLLGGGDEALQAVRARVQSAPRIPASSVKLLAPLPRPGKIICVGQNYTDHCREQNVPLPESPILFAKFNNTVLNPGDPIRLPSLSSQVDYEAELAFVVGKPASHVSQDRALDYIAGYLCLNDVSARDIQFGDKQWVRGKSFDTFCPMGPFLVTRDEVPDPQALSIRCEVSGERLQDSTTANMIFNCAFLLSFISRAISLEPGDIVTTGTPDGVGVFRKPPRFLKPGDTVTVSIAGLGELTNPVVAGE